MSLCAERWADYWVGASSAIRRIVTDWRSTLGEKLIGVALHFSTRKGPLKEKSYRDRLVNDAANTFLKGIDTEHGSAGDTVATITKRRVNLLQKGLEIVEEKSYQQCVLIAEEADDAADSDTDTDDDEAVLLQDDYTVTDDEAELLQDYYNMVSESED